MVKKEGYPLIDLFRVIAAILVVCIHTFPLQDINMTLDFYLTKGIGRLAVPFFFMTTAYFYFLKPSKQHLIKILMEYALIYFVAIIVYFPLNLYNLCFLQDNLFLKALKAIFIDGTFYHLWYLPAAMIGLMIVALLHKYVSLKIGLVIVSALYLIGLGGDSYYGLISKMPVFTRFYDIIFLFCDYTRNGIFMAPLFLWLGKCLVHLKGSFKPVNLSVGFLVSLGLMLVEVVKLKALNIPRHDAMNIMLPIVMIFLYLNLINLKGKRIMICQKLSLLIYLVHPWMIVIVRLISKVQHNEALINNSLIHFIAVLVISIIVSLGTIKIRSCYGK